VIRHSQRVLICGFLGLLAFSCPSAQPEPSSCVIAFYYGWYGNPETDGAYDHWNHPVVDKSGKRFPGGDDIGANFYPQAGCYSCNDPRTLDRQMRELKSAGVGVVSSSWWGKGSSTDKLLPKLLDAAAHHGLKVNIHVEPFSGRNAATTREAIVYILNTHGAHAGFHRGKEFGGRPVFFVYDSYLTPALEWAQVLGPQGTNTLRGTRFDAAVIGLWVKEQDGEFMKSGYFDGFYTYFAADGFTYGSTSANWPKLNEFARRTGKLFVPSVGPGYVDTRIRPWNDKTTRNRENGTYYDREFKAALDSGASLISITSYNEWHEGTQIEPATPKRISDFKYQDYSPLPPDYYLKRTAYWVGELKIKSR
jgi:glycoprotein endo-alpha-1,2-mannosidase